jgi:hypothetical protein
MTCKKKLGGMLKDPSARLSPERRKRISVWRVVIFSLVKHPFSLEILGSNQRPLAVTICLKGHML